MAKKIVIDLGDRFKNAFGFVGSRQSNNLDQQRFMDQTGIINVPVFVNNNVSFEDFTLSNVDNSIKLKFGYTNLESKGDLTKIFAPPPMISYRKEKNIEETDIDGVDAQVVERYGHRAWEITIQGLLIDMVNHSYPSAQVKEMRIMFETDAAFAVEGDIWKDLGINSIYFRSFDISGVQGYEDTMQYTLQAKSIVPVEAALVKSNQ